MELTLGAALLAGLLSFLSPCVLPVVPAYLGQLGALAVARTTAAQGAAAEVPATGGRALAATGGTGGTVTLSPAPAMAVRRWQLLPHALAFVLGFGGVFTFMGLFVYVAAGPLRENLPLLQRVAGIVLIVLGLNLAGVLRLSVLARTWHPLERLAPRRGLGGPVATQTPLGAFGLGAMFAVGWTPCIGPTLGAILGIAAVERSPSVALLLVAYSVGLGVPFIVMALAFDRARAITRPIIRHGRAIELIGGALVVVIGVAMLFDWLLVLYQAFGRLFPSPI